ncbi:hypothetical protein CLOM_g8420 [Closterium sp. NIES-68]|nr:hypothetical protein CLOM_g8420 [Closterium sp. NIES-68]GJP81008.1 hypothetical protein CLOP_g11192 [Closterium sp. NIES-67]
MEEEEEQLHCLGTRCFQSPHDSYRLPTYYDVPLMRGEKAPGRDYRWMVGMRLKNEAGARPKRHARLAAYRAVALPQCLGLGDDGRWRWQHIPLALLAGFKLTASALPASPATTATTATAGSSIGVGKGEVGGAAGAGLGGERRASTVWSASVTPHVRLQVLTPLLGKIALRPWLDVLPRPAVCIKRSFNVGTAKLSLRAKLQAEGDAWRMRLPSWTLQLDWRPADSVRVQREGQQEDSITLKYTKGFHISRDCRGVVSGLMELPCRISSVHSAPLFSLFPRKFGLESLRLTQVIGTRAPRDPPLSTRRYLQAAQHIGRSDAISVVPGHWIDPGFEPGAPGEREFNLEVADALERQLRSTGWDVLRPDRDAPNLQWEQYLNWVSTQTMRGVPVIEIHGQGSNADYRGFVLGVIGDKDTPLNKELARKFGHFAMDWRELAVPRRGGTIVESFNSDEVLQMAPWHRQWAVSRLANRIATCVERASAPNRMARGVHVPASLLSDAAYDRDLIPEPGSPLATPRSPYGTSGSSSSSSSSGMSGAAGHHYSHSRLWAVPDLPDSIEQRTQQMSGVEKRQQAPLWRGLVWPWQRKAQQREGGKRRGWFEQE